MEGNETLFLKGEARLLKNLNNLKIISLKSCNVLP